MLADGVQLVDVGAPLHQRPRRLLFVGQADAIRWQCHQRGPATGQQHDEQIGSGPDACAISARAARGDAAGRRERVTAVVPFGGFRQQLRRMRTNAEHASRRHGRRRSQRVQHHGGRLAGRNHVHRGCALERRNDVRVVERAPHQQTRIDAIDGGANDRREILAEPGVKLCQLRGVN